jgi:hypothetical protein
MGLCSFSALSSAFMRRDTMLCCLPGSADGSMLTSDFSLTSFASLVNKKGVFLRALGGSQGGEQHSDRARREFQDTSYAADSSR